MKKKDWIYFIFIAILFAVFYYFVCEDSPVHDLFYTRNHIDRRDPPWYFSCGKALANGMIPYVEFSDSKGPLLWLVYALAYIISPRDYFGVYLIHCVLYVISLLLLYRTVKIFTADSLPAAIITLLTIPLLFIPSIHYETKSEDLSFIFIALSLWQTCRMLYDESFSQKDWGRTFFIWGICFGATLMIKYNSSIMLGVFLCFMLIKLYKEKRRFWPMFWKAVGGAALVVVPLLVWLAVDGALLAFLDDYFIQTPQTIANLAGGKSYFLQMMGRHDFVWIMVMILAGCGSACFWLPRWKFFPLASGAWFIVMILIFARGYYINICGPLMIFVPLTFLFAIKNHKAANLICAGAMLVVFGFLGYTHRNWYTSQYFGGGEGDPRRVKAAAMNQYIASKAYKPFILYYGCSDKGYGMESEGLPACRYWSLQGGATARMTDNQKECVELRMADFALVKTDAEQRRKHLRENGYRQVKLEAATGYYLYEKIPGWKKRKAPDTQ